MGSDTDGGGRGALCRLVVGMRADTGVLDGTVAAVRDRLPLIAALPAQEVRRHVAALLDAVIDAFAGRTGLDAAAAAAAERLAFDRAVQGVPLVTLLDGVQAGRAYATARLIESARVADLSDVALDALVEIDGYVHELRNRLIDAYRATEADLARSGYDVRVRALRELLHGDPVASVTDAGLDKTRRYHCVVANVTESRQVVPVEAALTASDGIAGIVDGYLCCVTSRLPEPARLTDILLVTSPAAGLDDIAECYRACRTALDAGRRRGLRGPHRLTALAAAVATDSQPRLGRLLAEEYLAPLDPADPFHRLLVETAAVYLDRGRRVAATAAALHVHTNTIKHRLRRFAELTGFDPAPAAGDAPAHDLRWSWSCHVWITGLDSGPT